MHVSETIELHCGRLYNCHPPDNTLVTLTDNPVATHQHLSAMIECRITVPEVNNDEVNNDEVNEDEPEVFEEYPKHESAGRRCGRGCGSRRTLTAIRLAIALCTIIAVVLALIAIIVAFIYAAVH